VKINPSKFQTYWIHSIFITSPLFFRTGDEGISALDIIFGAYFFGSLAIWFFWKVFVKKEKIIRNIADFFIILFPILSIGTMILSLINEVSFLNIIREYILFSFLLYYFPIRENLQSKDAIIKLAITFSISVIVNDIAQFYDYYHEFTRGVRYAYQIMTGQRINQTIFTFSILAGILALLYPQKLLSKVWLIFVVGITAMSLITTSSRTFWIIVLLGILIYLVVLPKKQKINLMISTFLSTMLIGIVIILFFQDKAQIVFKAIQIRLESTTEGKKDISVTNRFVEYDAVINKIKENPLGGNGFSKQFVYYNSILQYSLHSIYTHNGYLFFTYRYGIPLALIYFFPIFYLFGKSIFLYIRIHDLFYKFVVLGGFTGLILLIISSVTSAQFMNRDGIFVLAISFALVEVADYYRDEQNENKLVQKWQ